MVNTPDNRPTLDELKAFDSRVRRIITRVPAIMQNHKLEPLFKGWKLTGTVDGLVVLFGVLDDDRIMAQTQTPLGRYLSTSVLHDIATVACDGKYQVVRCNHTGAGYAVLLKAARVPRLPRQITFPGFQSGQLAWGITFDAQPVVTGWDKHMIIAGMTGSGKSSMLRGLVAQALLEGFQIALCDTGGNTFPMLENHPALILPLVTEPADAVGFAQGVLDEMQRRRDLYQLVAGYPDSMDEYNALAVAQGREPLKRLVVVFDEFTDVVSATGGIRKDFSQMATRIALGARKWGMTLVFAGHQFQREVSGMVREQCGVRVCFKVEHHDTASVVVNSGQPVDFTTTGRALMRGTGRFQAYMFPKNLLIDLAQDRSGVSLTAEEKRIVQTIGRNKTFSWEAVAKAAGMGQGAARRLVEAWERRGLASKTSLPGGPRQLTDETLRLAGVE